MQELTDSSLQGSLGLEFEAIECICDGEGRFDIWRFWIAVDPPRFAPHPNTNIYIIDTDIGYISMHFVEYKGSQRG